jgi:hypothetical protein
VKQKYGLQWDDSIPDIQIEFWMLRKGKHWLESQGRSLFFHHKEAQKLIWPTDDHHRWSDLALKSFTTEEITVMMGCGDSNKTYSMCRFILVDYWAFADSTLWLISSTEYRGAELRIWGKIKELFNRAKAVYDWLPGSVLESMHAITTDEIDDDREYARSLQRGLILVPCKKGSTYVGLSAYVGVKAPRLRHAGDEVQHMTTGFLDAYSNWYGKADFIGIMAGNPTDVTDPLCTAGEPANGGWDNFVDTEKTQTWRSRFFNAHVIAFDGRDSPNLDYPRTAPTRYTYLIGHKKLDAVSSTYGVDSWQWFNQCVGKPNKSLVIWRVITRQMCEQHGAKNDVVWKGGDEHMWIYAIDPSWGGLDKCIGVPIEIGFNIDGVSTALVHPMETIPVSLKLKLEPEEQIAKFFKKRLDEFGNDTPVPIDAGGVPSERPVRFDLFVDESDGSKRLKTSREHYSKRITEIWFSVSEAIQSEQIRGLSQTTIDEGCARIYKVVRGDKIELETKDDYKERVGKSPNEFDALGIGIERARQLGFKIQRLGMDKGTPSRKGPSWIELQAKSYQALLKSKELQQA